MKTPTFPLRSRADMAAYILALAGLRPGYSPLAFDVKLSVFASDLLPTSEEIRQHCADGFWRGTPESVPAGLIADALDELDQDEVYELALDDLRVGVVGHYGHDAYRWVENDPVDVTYEFRGRAGGWLCVTEYEGYDLTRMDMLDFEAILTGDDATDFGLETMPFPELRRLYKLCVMLSEVWTTNEFIETELNYLAGSVIANRCDDLLIDWIVDASEKAWRVRDVDCDTSGDIVLIGDLKECETFAERHNRKVTDVGGDPYLQVEPNVDLADGINPLTLPENILVGIYGRDATTMRLSLTYAAAKIHADTLADYESFLQAVNAQQDGATLADAVSFFLDLEGDDAREDWSGPHLTSRQFAEGLQRIGDVAGSKTPVTSLLINTPSFA